jgi:hypothetical protein
MNIKPKFTKHLKVVLFIVLALLILTTITMAIFSFLNKPKVVETKTFSEIPGFSFEYPVFKGWEVKEVMRINEGKYYVFFKSPLLTGIAPSMKIENNYIMVKRSADYTPITNRNNVLYRRGTSSISFEGFDYFVDIYPFLHEGDGYSGKALTDKIVETFKFTDANLATNQAESVSQSKIKAPQEVIPVSYLGVKYSARVARMGYVEAYDEKTGLKLWEKKVYDVKIDPYVEEDVQWVFIKELKIENQQLIVTNTNDEVYSITIMGAAIPPIAKRIR